MLQEPIAYERKSIPQAWSDEEKAKLLQMHRAGHAWAEIAEELGRSESAVKSKLKYEQVGQVRRSFEPSIQVVPPDVLRERQQRLAAAARDLAGALMGDPPQGFSALDRQTR